MLHHFLPRSLVQKIEATVEAVRARWESIAHRQLDQAEAELVARQEAVDHGPQALTDAAHVNRIEDVAPKNGRAKTKA